MYQSKVFLPPPPQSLHPFLLIAGIHYDEESANEVESVEINQLGYNDVAHSHGPKTMPLCLEGPEQPSKHATNMVTTGEIAEMTPDNHGNEDLQAGEGEGEEWNRGF